MQAQFIHCADVHLGNHQYQNNTRYNDFAQAFLRIVDDAIARQVSVFLVAGDIFHKRAIDAITLFQAKEAFGRLKSAGIPAIVIEGNHDRAYYRDANVSWLSYLTWTGDIIMLAPDISPEGITFAPWSPEARNGGYYDVPATGMRIYGLPWYGAATGALLAQVAAELRRMHDEEAAAGVRYRVLMLHTGVDGMVPNLHGLPTASQFTPLREVVDYVALGHVHKPYEIEGFIFNPGSTETVSAEEAAWQRGYYVVDVTDQGHQPHHIANPQRPFLRWKFAVDGLASPTELRDRFTGFIQDRSATVARAAHRFAEDCGANYDADPASFGPVVDVTLHGTLAFDHAALDKRELEALVREHTAPLLVQIRNFTDSLDYAPTSGELDGRDHATRQELELSVFRDLLLRDARYAADAPAWARVVAELKQKALDNDDPAVIAAWLSQSHTRIQTKEE